jgi:hypothetical protein
VLRINPFGATMLSKHLHLDLRAPSCKSRDLRRVRTVRYYLSSIAFGVADGKLDRAGLD